MGVGGKAITCQRPRTENLGMIFIFWLFQRKQDFTSLTSLAQESSEVSMYSKP